MSFDGIKVNHTALDQAALDMRNAVGAIRQRLEHLQGELGYLKQEGAWEGLARTSFDDAKRTWDQAMLEMGRILERTHTTVSDSNEAYRRTDVAAAAGFLHR